MIEQVLSKSNMLRACEQVMANKGSAGVDGMCVEKLPEYLRQSREKLVHDVINCKYKVQPILGVEIPKSNGRTRLLGVPTVKERLLQQVVSQVMAARFECDFKAHSYGFRPGRSAQEAVMQAQRTSMRGISILLI